MDFRKDRTYRIEAFESYNRKNNNRYDFERDGVLDKCIPKVLFRGNPILVSFLQLIDIKIIMLLKCVERIKEFKHITKY